MNSDDYLRWGLLAVWLVALTSSNGELLLPLLLAALLAQGE